MRSGVIIVGIYAVAMAAIGVVVTAAFSDARERSLKETRELDAAIDQIVARQMARRATLKQAALAGTPDSNSTNTASSPPTGALALGPATSAIPTAAISGTTGQAPRIVTGQTQATLQASIQANAAERERAQALDRKPALARVRPVKSRQARPPNVVTFVPAAFASVSKFAVHTVVGLR